MLKKLHILFAALAILLSDAMCAVVAYYYCDMMWGIRYAGYSAPSWIAFLFAIPFAAAIVICIFLAVHFKRKADKEI